jgi:hypothetical protein
MTSPWEPTAGAVLATVAVLIPTANLLISDLTQEAYVSVNAIVPVFACIPFRAWRRLDNPCHCCNLLLGKVVFMRVLTLRKETLREIILVAWFLGEITNEAQQSCSSAHRKEGLVLLSGSSRGQGITARRPISCFLASNSFLRLSILIFLL